MEQEGTERNREKKMRNEREEKPTSGWGHASRCIERLDPKGSIEGVGEG
jgi:hypothetical protein